MQSDLHRYRQGLEEAIGSVREGDTLVVRKLDRLGRSLRQLIGTINHLQECGISFKSLTEQIDTNGDGKPIFHVFGALAGFERDVIREQTQARLTGGPVSETEHEHQSTGEVHRVISSGEPG